MGYDELYDTRLDNKYGALTTIDIPAEIKTVILMVEGAGVTPTGDAT